MTRSPVWAAIADSLRDDIAQGRYGPGDKLPTEAALSARFGVNRHTVRHALKALADEGRVHARRGAGVFVTAGPMTYPITQQVSFRRNLRASGRMPGRSVLTLEHRRATPREAEALALPDDMPLICATGVSSADATPIALYRSCFPGWLPDSFGPDLQRSGSVTQALALAGIPHWTRVATAISARIATAVQADQLRLPQGAALIHTEAVNAAPDGRIIEFGITWFAGDRVTLQVQDATDQP